LSRAIERLIIKAAERIADQYKSKHSLELRYSLSTTTRKAAERGKLMEKQMEELKEQLSTKKEQYDKQIESTKINNKTQVSIMSQKITQLEKELQEKTEKYKIETEEKEAEIIKKLTEYKDKVLA
jgi:hypothetical protein